MDTWSRRARALALLIVATCCSRIAEGQAAAPPRLPPGPRVFSALLAGPSAAPDVSWLPQPRTLTQADSGPDTGNEASVFFFSETEIVSSWIWRGWVLQDGAAVQPANGFEVGNFTVSSWFNLAAAERAITEHDLTVEYGRDAGRLRLTAGWVNYFFAEAESDKVTQEVYAGVAFDSPLSPALTVFRDVQAGNGTYIVGSVSHDVSLAGGVRLTAGLSLGYNDHLWIDGSSFSDAAVSLAVAVPRAGALSITPRVTWSRSLNDSYFQSKVAWGVTVGID
jgi:hypothetical protein